MVVACEIGTETLDSVSVRLWFIDYIDQRQFLHNIGWQFSRIDQLDITLLHVINRNLTHLKRIDLTRMLIDNIHNIL